jgi:molecular chaperone DnaJ
MAAQREWFEKDYYKELGVATRRPPRRSPRRTASWRASCTPTRTPATRRPRSGSRPSRRPTTCSATRPSAAEYDEVRRLGPMAAADPAGPRRVHVQHGRRQRQRARRPARQMFGRRTARAARPAPDRAAAPTSEAELTLDFVDAARGMTTTLHLTSDAQCSTCDGSAPAPARRPKLCPQCGGRRRDRRQPGPLLVLHAVSPVRRCRHGDRGPVSDVLGERGREPGPRGPGAHPAGVSDGQTIRPEGPRCARAQRWSRRGPAGAAAPSHRTRGSAAPATTGPCACR